MPSRQAQNAVKMTPDSKREKGPQRYGHVRGHGHGHFSYLRQCAVLVPGEAAPTHKAQTQRRQAGFRMVAHAVQRRAASTLDPQPTA